MRLIAVMPLRNESWIAGLSLRAALRWVDGIVALEHACTDRTPEILAEVAAEHPGRVRVIRELYPLWREMAHRQRLLDEARAWGATHVALVDADEVLTADLLPVVRQHIEALPPGGYLRSRMFCMWRGIDRYRHDGSVWSNRTDLALAFRDAWQLHWEARDGYDHHHRNPHCSGCAGFLDASGGVMHLQFADWRRMVAKHALYRVNERLRWPHKPVAEIDRLYSQATDEHGIGFASARPEWWESYRDLLPHLRLGEEPWQEAEVRRLVAEHGREHFAGLNLYGIA